MNASDFIYISNPDGSCHFWYCGKEGVVLCYDDMAPEFGIWMCSECWADFADLLMLVIVEDRRPKVIESEATTP